jgi:hypothetical protein
MLVKRHRFSLSAAFDLDSLRFDFMCSSCITCYQAAQIAEIFHFLQLLLIYHDLH